MARLNQEREKELTPKRSEYAKEKLHSLGYEITYEDGTRIEFLHKGEKVVFYPYSGWFAGKTVIDSRGIENLINQLKKDD